jgi:acyl-CoA synthetase (AMP-forming)/AMP-acid ligase II
VTEVPLSDTNGAAASVGPSHGQSVRDLIEYWADKTPTRAFLICPEHDRVVSYGDLRREVAAFAHQVGALGVKPGESVAFAAGNGYGSTLAFLGSLYGGFRATPLNLVAGGDALAYVLGHSGSRLILVSEQARPLIEQAARLVQGNPTRLRLDPDNGPDWPCTSQASGPGPAPDEGSVGLLMYTSGTTGRPKGVLLSHGNLIAGGQNTALAHELTADDRALCVLPLYHINGQCVTVMGPLVSGGSVVMPHRFSASRFWRQLIDGECSWFSVVPTLISYLLQLPETETPDRRSLSRLRFGRSASAALPPAIHRAFESRFGIPIVETMGLTETAAQILSNPLPPGRRKYGSPGVAYGNQVVIADEHQQPCPPDTVGELLVRGRNVMLGYLNNPKATADTLTADGWLRTGDLGVMDEDGYVFVRGRIKELIIKGGENIAPREVDEALYAQPGVLEAAAFARPCPDYGQRVEACVVLKPGVEPDEAGLISACTARLGPFKSPDRIHFRNTLPKGPSGKIQRLKLLDLVDLEAGAA